LTPICKINRRCRDREKGGCIIFSKTIKAELGSIAAAAAEEVLSRLFLKDYQSLLHVRINVGATWRVFIVSGSRGAI
jgi:hypothetical protein